MTTKTMMMALAMAMGLAASASVIEVKFTVKTDVNGKVTTKTYKGVYDTTAGKHAFYDTKAKKTIDGSYFGLVNGTTAGKKVGQNAELIWGDASNPENVLVAGAWGTDSSKSGQVAGIIDGKPATGTWTAKENTKKTYEELLKKYKITVQPTNKATSLIDDKTAAIASALNDAAAAEAKAAADLAAAQAQAAADLAAAQAQAAADLADAQKAGEDAVTAAQNKAEADLAAAEAKAAADLAAAEAKAAADIAEAQKNGEDAVKAAQEKAAEDLAKVEADNEKALAEAQKAGEDAVKAAQEKAAEDLAKVEADNEKALADAEQEKTKALEEADKEFKDALAKKDGELDKANATIQELSTMIEDLKVLNDPDMYAMISTWITNKNQNAKEVYLSAYAKILTVTNAYNAYADSLDLSKLHQNCVDATNALREAEAILAKQQGLLDTTNKAWKALDDKCKILEAIYNHTLWNMYYDSTGKVAQAEAKLQAANDSLEEAKEGLEEYIAGKKAELEVAEDGLTTASNTFATASSAVATAYNNLAAASNVYVETTNNLANAENSFIPPSYEDGKLLSYEQWVEENSVTLDPDKVDYHGEYEEYKAKTIAEAKAKHLKEVEDARDVALVALKDAEQSFKDAEDEEIRAKNEVKQLEGEVERLKDEIANAEAGKADTIAEAEKAVAEAREALEKAKAEYEYWLAFEYSDNYKTDLEKQRDQVKADMKAIEADIEATEADIEAKKAAIDAANQALVDVAETQEALLKKLADVMGRDVEEFKVDGGVLPLDDIKAEVDKYLGTPYKDYEAKAIETGLALEKLAEALKIEFAPEVWAWLTELPDIEEGSDGADAGDGEKVVL